jgi:hypothetical protein
VSRQIRQLRCSSQGQGRLGTARERVTVVEHRVAPQGKRSCICA